VSTVTEHANKKESVAASELVTGDRIGRFIISSRLGKGGMGEVYQAQDSRLKRTVALKRLSAHLRADPLYRRRFEEEAERASTYWRSGAKLFWCWSSLKARRCANG
jgi:serine/threonine protein kinase